jgi:hypothetical protein
VQFNAFVARCPPSDWSAGWSKDEIFRALTSGAAAADEALCKKALVMLMNMKRIATVAASHISAVRYRIA